MRQSIEQRLINFFEMPVEKIISELHWKQNRSINDLAIESNIVRQSIMYLCKVRGLKLRSLQNATKLTKNKGPKHFNFGKTKETSLLCKKNSDRMKLKNPSFSEKNKTKAAVKIAEYFRENPWPQEIEFKTFLEKHNVEFIFQYALGPYIIDFFIKAKKLCIEIDSTDKWGSDNHLSAKRKDAWLLKNGFEILRLNKRTMLEPSNIRHVLDCLDIVSQK